MPSFKARGVQLFRDYVTAFRVLDPWVVSEQWATAPPRSMRTPR